MKQHLICCSVSILLSLPGAYGNAQGDLPREWIEPETGHRVIRLSDEPDSHSLYFHQYPFSADGKWMVFTTPDSICSVNLETRKIKRLVEGNRSVLVTGRKSGDIYYVQDDGVHAANLSTGELRKVVDLPLKHRWPRQLVDRVRANDRARQNRDAESTPRSTSARARRPRSWGNITVNCDETMIVGIGYDPDGEAVPREFPPGASTGGRLGRAWSSGVARVIYTIDIATGETSVIHRSNSWLNHLQCSPTDPEQILFCHEGPWHYVDRTWLIRTDGTELTQVHQRTIDMEIAGHEFFSEDGKTVWYDLQTPRSMVFWLAGYEISTGKRTWYHLERDEWSVHYNISPDGTLFSGDGGGSGSVANMNENSVRFNPTRNGQWMYLFTPQLTRRTGLPAQAADQVKTGRLQSQRLVNLGRHDYQLEPNGIFTPDGKWLVFRANMHGPGHVYAVELERSSLPN